MAARRPAAAAPSESGRVADLGGRPVDAPLARRFATVVAIAFLAVGVLGFVPGITSDLGDITFAGHESEAELLGIFQVSILHNIVHLLFGIAGVAVARTAAASRNFLIWGGAIYLVLWIFGMFVAGDNPANFVPVNTADNWLHFVLGVGMIALGLLLTRDRTTTRRRSTV
ncbi:MAG TPA: DUF4383 domain-containing protein [Acidimicrobiales bacterium]|nr:DUF4383 domain-containing protein [Acidimicrobiales bacterium]